MPNIAELGLGIGDRVKFQSQPLYTEQELGHQKPDEEFQGEIAAIDDNLVYLLPLEEKRWHGAGRVLNIQTGEIGVRRAVKVVSKSGQVDYKTLPLDNNERVVIGINRNWGGFYPVETGQK